MHLWTSTEAADALRVGVSSIKRWTEEGRLEAVKTPGNHRRYTLAELHRFAAERGLPADRLPPLAESGLSGRRSPATILAAVMKGDTDAVRRLVTPGTNDLAARAAFLDDVVGDTLRKIGELWVAGKMTVDEEHRATYMIAEGLDRLRPPAAGQERPLALLACPPEEQHDVPLRMLRLVMEWRGWRTDYAGANVPWSALQHAVRSRKPALVAMSARSGNPFRQPEFANVLALAKSQEVELIVGGEWCRGGSGQSVGYERFRTLRGYVRSPSFRRVLSDDM
jgi:excisionase family DNA binding protein